jgi:hypothetical protein
VADSATSTQAIQNTCVRRLMSIFTARIVE